MISRETLAMGFFSKKPDKQLQADLVKHGTYAITWFGHALRFKKQT